MRRLVDILLFVALMMVTSCRELPDYLVGDDTIARVGRNELIVADMADVIPANLKGEDSVVFVKQYVDKWIVRQLKVEEADRLFSGSEKDIEKLVEDYRQSLLTGKVDQYYVDQQKGGEFTDEDIAEYYNTHKSDFVLDRTLVKGRIVGFPASYRQSKKLMEQMPPQRGSATYLSTCWGSLLSQSKSVRGLGKALL